VQPIFQNQIYPVLIGYFNKTGDFKNWMIRFQRVPPVATAFKFTTVHKGCRHRRALIVSRPHRDVLAA